MFSKSRNTAMVAVVSAGRLFISPRNYPVSTCLALQLKRRPVRHIYRVASPDDHAPKRCSGLLRPARHAQHVLRGGHREGGGPAAAGAPLPAGPGGEPRRGGTSTWGKPQSG